MCDTALPLRGTYPISMCTRYVLLGLFLSWISNPEPSKNIGPLQPTLLLDTCYILKECRYLSFLGCFILKETTDAYPILCHSLSIT